VSDETGTMSEVARVLGEHYPDQTSYDAGDLHGCHSQHLGYELENARRLLRDRDRLLRVMAEMRATNVWDPYEIDDRYCARTLRFMTQHPTCDIGIRDEYGKDHPITPEEAP
jgi:hypothetical protein